VDDIQTAKLTSIPPDPVLGAPNIAAVQQWTVSGACHVFEAAQRQYRKHSTLRSKDKHAAHKIEAAAAIAEAAAGETGLQELLVEYRCRLLRVVKACYGREGFQYMSASA